MAINTLFQNIADAIRIKNGASDTYTPAEMPDAILSIETGETYPTLPVGYTELKYMTIDASYPYITSSLALLKGDVIKVKFNGNGVMVGKRSSGWNFNAQNQTAFSATLYNITKLFYSWEEITQELMTPVTAAFTLNSAYTGFTFCQWGTDYHYTGDIYAMTIQRFGYKTADNVDDIKPALNYIAAFVPCYRNEDGVNGFYDTVNNVFYEATSGTFIRGEEV